MKITKIVDLSHNINNSTIIYPGDPKPNIQIATTIKNDGYNLFSVYMGTQSGSHVDAPYHFKNTGTTIDSVNLDICMGKAVIINVSKKYKGETIDIEDIIPYQDKISQSKIVLFQTNWYKKINTEEFFNNPYLSETGGKYLLQQGIKTIGIDSINIDASCGDNFPIHDMYAEADGLIAENLTNFDAIDFINPFVICLPLKLTGCDGSPVRAIALDIDCQ